jgi:hypothetical protein
MIQPTGVFRISASLILFIADFGSGFVSVPCEWYVRLHCGQRCDVLKAANSNPIARQALVNMCV